MGSVRLSWLACGGHGADHETCHRWHATAERHVSFSDQEELTPMAWMPVPDKDAPFFTIDAYLALERTEEERHEYLDGCVYAMAGESPDHGTICMNLSIHLGSQLLVEHYHRQEDDPWTLHTLEGLQAQLHVPSIGCTVALAAMYDRLVFPA